jgi:6-phosphogluconate dehydrogenase
MELAMIGLGKMGANMTRRLIQDGHHVIGFDLNKEQSAKLAEETGVEVATSMEDAIGRLGEQPKVVWLMVPAGGPVQSAVELAAGLLERGDIVVDGGNSNYKDTMRRGEMLAKEGIHFVDVGTSGGVWGLEIGYSMMVGGNQEAVAHLRPALESLAPAPDKGWGRVGPSGAGHFVKMVHNGIEYGLMQAYAEGFEIMGAKKIFELDLHQIAQIWQHGSVVRSWLLDLTALALEADPKLASIRAWVADSGEGRWTIQEAIDLEVPAPVISLSLMARYVSRQQNSYAARLLAALRNEFGGHAVKRVAQEAMNMGTEL